MCTPFITAGLKFPPPSKTISLITRLEVYSTRLAKGLLEGLRRPSAFKPGTLDETVSFVYGMKNWGRRREERRIDSTAEERSVSRWKESGIDETGHRSDPTDKTGRRSDPTENERRSGSDAGGERLLLIAKLKCHFSLT